jgi:alkylation response protein AidB-like acyl-CoA dehydrogenase
MNTQLKLAVQKPGLPPPRATLQSALDPLAIEDDRTDGAPIESLKHLAAIGAGRAVLPSSLGGAELGWSPSTSPWLAEWLRALGSTHLSLARLYEGHVNAFQLVWTYGNSEQREVLCRYVAEGGWLGVWNAPHPSGPLRLRDSEDGGFVLDGQKSYASGAGLIDCPLVTAQHEELGYVMVWSAAKYQVGSRQEWEMHGMRASVTLPVHYREAVVDEGDIVGTDNDYHREPLFTTGAWRFLAAQLGAAERLIEWMATALCESHRDSDPHQRARMGEAAMALETATLWLERARLATVSNASTNESTHLVRMARLAVEQQLLLIVQHVQRSIGLSAFRRDNPMERMTRDLLTYLRQPVPDLVRDQVGARAMAKHAKQAPAG